MVLEKIFGKSKKKKRAEEEEQQRQAEEVAAAAERRRVAEEHAKQQSFIHSPLLEDKLDEVGELLIACFAEMERSGEGLAQRWEADHTLTKGISFETMIEAVHASDLSFTDDQTVQLFQAMDVDGDGVLQLAEFHAYCTANPEWAKDGLTKRSVTGRVITPGGEIVTRIFEKSETGNFRIVEIFFLVDTDGSGEMDRQEFEVALEMMGISLAPEDLDLAFDELDEDKGGTIEIEEFMARMRREKRWKKEDAEHERELDAREQEARMIEGLTGEAKQIAIENAGNSAWNMARMRMQLAQWKEEGVEEYEDDDYAAYMKEEMEAQLAEAAHAKEEEEAQLAEEEHAKEEQEALEAEARLAKEEAEAAEALAAAKQEELEAKLAADRAEKEMREAIAAERKAAREQQEAIKATEKLQKERMEAAEAQKEVDVLVEQLEAFITGPLADAINLQDQAARYLKTSDSIEEHDSNQARTRRGSTVKLEWADNAEFSKTDINRYKQAEIQVLALEDRKQELETELETAKEKAAKELAEAVEAERVALKETMEAEEAERTAARERQEAIEAQEMAAKEKAEAVEARRLAQIELDDVAEARENAERERREAEEAKVTAMKEREEADEAHAVALKEREEADQAKLKYFSKIAREYGIKWRDKARASAKAKRREERKRRRDMIAAAPPTPSVVEKMLGHVGAECYRWEAEVATEVAVEPGQVTSRARHLQGLRKEYIAALTKEQRLQRTVPGSGKLPRVRATTGATALSGWAAAAGSVGSSTGRAQQEGSSRPHPTVGFGGFGANASSFVPASSTPRGRPPPTPHEGRQRGSETDRGSNWSARRRRSDSMGPRVGGGTAGWAVRGAGGTLSSARDSARRATANVTFTSSFDRQSLTKVVQFSSGAKQVVTLPTTKPTPPPPRLSGAGVIGRAKLPPPPPTPARVLHKASLRDAALLNAFERAEKGRPAPFEN